MKVLVAYDGSPYADAAIDDLENAGLPRETEVLVVCVANKDWPPHAESGEGPFDNRWKATIQAAESFAETARYRIQTRFPGWKVIGEALWGEPEKILLQTIERWGPDLVVIGSHGWGVVGRLMLGSVSLALVHHAPCSVRVVRINAPKASGSLRVLAATDGSEEADAVIREIARRTWPDGTEVRVVSVLQTLVPSAPTLVPALEDGTFASEPAYHVIEEADDRERARLSVVNEKSAERLQTAGLRVSTAVVEGNPGTRILDEANRWDARAIFVGARGLGAVNRLLLGSVSSSIVTHAHCPVEVVRRP